MTSHDDELDEDGAGIPEPIFDRLSDSPSSGNAESVEAWHRSAPENPGIFEELQSIWRLSRAPGSHDGWPSLTARIERARSRGGLAPRRRWFSQAVPLSIAAGVAIAVGLAAMVPRLADSPAVEWASVTVPAGTMSSVELPGGIVVRLNSLASLQYPASLEPVTEVRLSGEGYFDIPHDPDRSFRVVTEAGTIHDIGTKFNVEARSGRVAVTVVEGVVELEAAGKKVEVVAGKSSYATEGQPPAVPVTANLVLATAWIEGRLVFHDEPLAEVAAALSRHFGVPFRVSEELRPVRLTAAMRAAASADAARAVCAAISARCEPRDGGWLITRRSGR